MKHYCVYFTIYLGNMLPPFYIGSSSVDKVNQGYHRSVLSARWKNTWQKEIKPNLHLFKSMIISCY